MRARHRHFKYSSAAASAAFDTRYIHGESDGNTIQTWSDRSGNGRHATQATAGNRATYKTAIQGGNAILRFDGGDFYIANYLGGTHFSLYSIYRRNRSNLDVVASAGISGNNTNSARRFDFYYDSTNFILQLNGGASVNFFTANNNWNLHSASMPVSTGIGSYFLNGANPSNLNLAFATGTTGTVRLVIGGVSWDTNLRLDGDIALIVTYETAHSSSFRRRLEHAAAFSFKIACS